MCPVTPSVLDVAPFHSVTAPSRRLLAIGSLPPPVTGLSTAFKMLCEGLPAYGWELDAIDLSDRTGERRNASFSIGRAARVLASVVRAWRRMRWADVVYLTIAHSAVGFARDALIIRGAALLGRAIVLHHHGGAFHEFVQAQPPWMRSLVTDTLNKADRIIVLGESLRHEFELIRDAASRVVVAHNACSVPTRPPREAPSRRLRVLYLSNLMLEKGYLDVLAAADRIAQLLPGVAVEFHFAGKFILGGDSFPDTAAMQADFIRRQAALPPAVSSTWHGVVGGAAKSALLEECDVFVLPTYYRDEGQPISIIEALVSSMPVITTAFRGIPELLPPEMQRLYVPPRDPDAIADRLALLATNGAVYERVSAAAARQAQNFTLEAHLRKLDGILRGVTVRDAT